MRPTVVQFGAGAVGRGFLGQLWTEAGLEVVYVDVDPTLVAALNARRAYCLDLVGPTRHESLEVRPVRAVSARDLEAVAAELGRCRFAATAVGPAVLPRLAPSLAAGLRRRRGADAAASLDVLLCENQLHCARPLHAALSALLLPEELAGLGLVECVVGRTIPTPAGAPPDGDPLRLAADDYPSLPVHAPSFRGALPDVPGLDPVPDLIPIVERKLLVHNMAHAVAAYLGAAAGCATVQEAMLQPAIADQVSRAMQAGATAVARRHGFSEAEVAHLLDDLDRRFRNPSLTDPVSRVGRDPLRKLSADDRLIGAVRACREQGVDPAPIYPGIAAALRFAAHHQPDDPLICRLATDPRAGIAAITGQPADGPVVEAILRETAGWTAGSPR